MIPYNTLVVLLGTCLLGANAGLVGSFAVLRRRALTGDALAHAALPGLCLAFLIVGERSLPVLLTGAFVSGVIGVMVIAGLRSATRVKEDAAIGIVLSVFFGLGIVLSSIVQRTEGVGSKAGLNSYILGKTAGILRQDVILMGSVSLLSLVVIATFYKEFKTIVFDPDFGRVQGLPVLLLDLILMGLIAVAVVFGLPMVGVVLMAALLILPSASARYWTDRLELLLLLATIFGGAIGLIGTHFSATYPDLPTGPVIVLVGSGFFVVSVLFAPRRGFIHRTFDEWRLRRSVSYRKQLRLLFDLAESTWPRFRRTATESLRSAEQKTRFLRFISRLVREGTLIEKANGIMELDPRLQREAADAARTSRLWEQFLKDEPDRASGLADLAEGSIEAIMPLEARQRLLDRLIDRGRWNSSFDQAR